MEQLILGRPQSIPDYVVGGEVLYVKPDYFSYRYHNWHWRNLAAMPQIVQRDGKNAFYYDVGSAGANQGRLYANDYLEILPGQTTSFKSWSFFAWVYIPSSGNRNLIVMYLHQEPDGQAWRSISGTQSLLLTQSSHSLVANLYIGGSRVKQWSLANALGYNMWNFISVRTNMGSSFKRLYLSGSYTGTLKNQNYDDTVGTSYDISDVLPQGVGLPHLSGSITPIGPIRICNGLVDLASTTALYENDTW